MNNHCFRTKETALANGRTLKLSYYADRGIWRMSGGKWGEHCIGAAWDGKHNEYEKENDRVKAHWDGYIKAQYV